MSKYRLRASRWTGEGTHRVEVSTPWPRYPKTDKGARRAALRGDPMGLARFTRIDRVALSSVRDPEGGGHLVYHLTIARADVLR